MATVDLDTEFTVYADVEMADEYADGAYHAASWRALTDEDAKARLLITATRLLDRQSWKEGYRTFAEREAEPNIVNASIELAFSMLDGYDPQNTQSTAERIQSISAGSVSITNFRSVDTATRFPQIVQELLSPYLGGSSSALFPKIDGEDTETIFPVELGYNTGL